MKTRIQARVVTFDPDTKSILLVRNPGAKFWYVPGGGQEEDENIKQCAVREMEEETGLHVVLERLLYVQELHDKAESMIILELFWLARLRHSQILNDNHIDIDPDGGIEETRWFTRDKLQDLTVYPEQLKDRFWENLEKYQQDDDPFLGVFE